MSNTTPQNGVFINGKAQVIDMLKHMSEDEKTRILNMIRIKNPTLAQELSTETLTFDSLIKLNDVSLKRVAQLVPAKIMGIALNNMPTGFQRDVLTRVDRHYAEEAFTTMKAMVNQEQIRRAQAKILIALGQVLKSYGQSLS